MAALLGKDLIETVFEWAGEHKLTKLVAFGGTSSQTTLLDLDHDSIQNFIIESYRKADEGVRSSGSKRNGELGGLRG